MASSHTVARFVFLLPINVMLTSGVPYRLQEGGLGFIRAAQNVGEKLYS